MADIRLLERTLASTVAWNKARINFVAKFLVALIQVRSVNLAEGAGVFAGGVQTASHYKRIQRFLRSFELPYAAVSIFRHGLDHLRRILRNQLCKAERVALRRVIKLLSCT
ncbi:MAG: hypothetical protein ACJ74W_21505 [Pyrinomonadaceae bacterium]